MPKAKPKFTKYTVQDFLSDPRNFYSGVADLFGARGGMPSFAAPPPLPPEQQFQGPAREFLHINRYTGPVRRIAQALHNAFFPPPSPPVPTPPRMLPARSPVGKLKMLPGTIPPTAGGGFDVPIAAMRRSIKRPRKKQRMLLPTRSR